MDKNAKRELIIGHLDRVLNKETIGPQDDGAVFHFLAAISNMLDMRDETMPPERMATMILRQGVFEKRGHEVAKGIIEGRQDHDIKTMLDMEPAKMSKSELSESIELLAELMKR